MKNVNSEDRYQFYPHISAKNRLPVKIIRGGSSKGIFVSAEDIPPMGIDRDNLILRLFGTPDLRQIDGLGGGDKLTSKLAVMGKSLRSDCHVSYLFAQVGTEFPDVDWTSNCGNISAGAALFAALGKYGENRDGFHYIAIEQANTGRCIHAHIPLVDEMPALEGNFEIGGVPRAGPRIDLDFSDFNGSTLNKGVFPTGDRQELINLKCGIDLPVTIIDVANLSILVNAENLGIDLTQSLSNLQMDKDLIDRLDDIRASVLIKLKMASEKTIALTLRRSVNPLVHLLGIPRTFRTLYGTSLHLNKYDILARSYSRGSFSKAFPVTGAIGVAVAAFVNGTIAEKYGCQTGTSAEITVGHPSGHLRVEVQVVDQKKHIFIKKATIGRTARLLLDGEAYLS